MGHLDGSVRYVWWSIQQLRARAKRESGNSRRRLCSRMPAAAGAVDLRHHSAAGKNSKRAWNDQARVEYYLSEVEQSSGRAKRNSYFFSQTINPKSSPISS